MSRGINRAKIKDSAMYESKQQHNSCIFISHKYEDLNVAREIAEYIMDFEIDVYLDDSDDGLQKAVENNDSAKIVKCIENALDTSTHILILVTENTRKSWWVPYETGFAKKGQKHIASLLLKNVNEFPDYLKIERTLTGYGDLSEYIRDIADEYRILLEATLASLKHRNALLNYISE